MIEVCANESGLLHSHAILAYQIRDATRGIDDVVWAVRNACLCGDYLDPLPQALFQNYDPCHAGIGRTGGDSYNFV